MNRLEELTVEWMNAAINALDTKKNKSHKPVSPYHLTENSYDRSMSVSMAFPQDAVKAIYHHSLAISAAVSQMHENNK